MGRLAALCGLVILALAAAGLAVIAYVALDDGKPSACFGSVVGGRLENGKRLAFSGENFRAYHVLGFLTGRTFVHGLVKDAVEDAYKALAVRNPELQFVYGETGWPFGGRFRPHRSHSNGTAVDFMVPLRDGTGKVAQVRVSAFNKLGYGVNFDDEGRRDGVVIDFSAIAEHLMALNEAAKLRGIAIGRVIFEPTLQGHLFAASKDQSLKTVVPFMDKPAWVRHDQHYHVDFVVPCKRE